MIHIRRMTVGPLQTNSYLVGCEESLKAAIIDPGWNGESIASMAEMDGWEVAHILITHSHFDHVAGLSALKIATEADIYIHPEAVDMLKEASMSAALYGYRIAPLPAPDVFLSDGQIVSVGSVQLEVIFTPGHAPGHVSFYCRKHHVLFDGDVLFFQGIGRTDTASGDHELLMKSIKERILTLPDATQVFPGHGPPTTVGQERQHNPFLAPAN